MAGSKEKHKPQYHQAYIHDNEENIESIAGSHILAPNPRARTKDDYEINIKNLELSKSGDLLCEVALNPMLYGL